MVTEVKNQSELEAAMATGNEPKIIGDGDFNISQCTVIYVSGSSQPRVVCYDSSQPRVVCYGSSQPRVVCKGYVQLCITGKATVTATAKVSVQTDGKSQIEGGQVIVVEPIRTAAEWCEVYGVPVVNGAAVLFKAVDEKFHSAHGFDYTPGTIPVAPDWDGGVKECGGGLHFCARPIIALGYQRDAAKFVACPIRLEDIAVHPNATMPSKVKARGCCSPVWEVDDDGERVAPVVVEPIAAK